MITISDYLKSWKAQDGQTEPIATLFDISISDAVTLRLVQGDPAGTGSVVYQGNTYLAAKIDLDEFEQTIEGDLRDRRLSVSNIDGIAGGYIETQELEGRTVTITHVPLQTLSPSDAQVETYTIQDQAYDRQSATVTLGYPNLTKRKVPWRRFERHRCQQDWVSRFVHEIGCSFPSDYFGPDRRQDFLVGATTNAPQKRRHGWSTLNALKATAFDVDGEAYPDQLHIESSDPEISWNGGLREGPFAFKLLSGDFDVFTEALVYDDRLGSLCGILAQETGGGEDSFVLLGIGHDASDEHLVRLAIAVGGTQQPDAETAIVGDAFLRLRRVGNVFTFFHAPTLDVDNPTSGWTQLAQKTVALDASVRLGLAIAGSSAEQSRVSVGFSFIRFIGGGPALCNQTFEQCGEYGNTARFFGFRGIPKR